MLRGAAGLVLAWLTPIRAAAQETNVPPPAPGDLLVRVDDAAFIPLSPDDVPFDGRALVVWPIGPTADAPKSGAPLNRILLARLNPATFDDATRARAADDIVAYSAICTHSGCEVDASLGDSQTIFCSCHNSNFDPRESGAVIGGPAPRRLAGAAVETRWRAAGGGRAVHIAGGVRAAVASREPRGPGTAGSEASAAR